MFGVSFGNANMERLSLLFAFVIGSVAQAQNLVPNCSFEEHDTCPTYNGYVEYATDWQNLHTHSADYFNACSESNIVDVPWSQFGYQYAANGQAYVGMATTAFGGAPWYREIVGIELTEPLQPGVPVCLSFQTAMGGFGNYHGNSTMYSSKGLGLKFFTEFPTDWHTYLYPNSAALYIDEVPTDTAVWYYVSGLYTPDSAYQYMAVGNFFADSLSERTLIDSSGFGTWDIAYAFVDDIRASFDLSFCDNANLVEDAPIIKLVVFPDPVVDLLNVSSPGFRGSVHISIYDASGRAVCQRMSNAFGPNYSVDVSDLLPGIYVLRMSGASKDFVPVRFVHVAH